jgi:hypothetical protein
MGQLTDDERTALANAIESLEGNGSGISTSFSAAMQSSATESDRTDIGAPAIPLDELPDWLAIRVLISLAPVARRACLDTVSWGRRWQLRRALLANRSDLKLTATTAAALLDCARANRPQHPSVPALS